MKVIHSDWLTNDGVLYLYKKSKELNLSLNIYDITIGKLYIDSNLY